jgi:ssDNA-binding Zn-finger/Zn-ribbon topoisomerase 1
MAYINEVPQHVQGELCPSCRSHDWRRKEFIGKLVLRKSKLGMFLGCTRFPDCKYTFSFDNLIFQRPKKPKKN